MSLFEMAQIPMAEASKLINLDPNIEKIISNARLKSASL